MKRFAYLSLFIFGALLSACASSQQREAVEAARARSQTAEALFQEHCKSAGEKIYKTVENVDGILLMKIRPEKANLSDQFALTDPYGDDLGGDGYIMNFLRGYTKRPDPPLPTAPPRLGYLYVDAIDPKDGQRYRYTGRIEEPWQYDKSYLKGYTRFVLDKISASGPAPRYGVTYDDLSTRQDREYWIAGSSLKVIDLQTNEVIAERIGYMMDRGQGSSGTGGARSPWLAAADHACPSFGAQHGFTGQRRQTEEFVAKVLKPIPLSSKKEN